MHRNKQRELENKSSGIIREVEIDNVSEEIVDGLPHHYELVDVTVSNSDRDDIILNQCPAYLTAPTPHAHNEEGEVDGLYETISSL